MPCLEEKYSEEVQEVEQVQEAVASLVIQPRRSSSTPVPVIEPSSSDTEPDSDYKSDDSEQLSQNYDACCEAIRAGDSEGLERIFSSQDFDSETTSQLETLAVEYSQIGCLRVMIRHGLTPNSIAFAAGCQANDDVREFIVQEYPDLPLGELSFDGAISAGFIQWAKDTAPDYIQQSQNTVDVVVQRNDMELLLWMVERYGVDQIDPENILISSASHGRLNMARYAVDLGARAFGRGTYYALASTASHVADYLLTLSPDVKYSAAYIAKENNEDWVVEYVLPNGIDPYIS